MLDPLSAASLASTVTALVDFSVKVVGTARGISAQGASADNIEIGNATQQLVDFSHQLQKSELVRHSANQNEIKLWSVCEDAKKVAAELINLLGNLKLEDGESKLSYKALWAAFRQVWKEPEIKAFQTRMEKIENRIQTLMIRSYSEKIDERIRSLNRTIRSLGLNRDLYVSIPENLAREHVASLLKTATTLREISAETLILEQLKFPGMNARSLDLDKHPAHHETLKWAQFSIADAKTSHESRICFMKWLESDDSIFWVSGKPGSGKSTLMKYLYGQLSSTAALDTWTRGRDHVTVAYFFWELGERKNIMSQEGQMHRNQEGLLRTLLFSILRQRPDLIRRIYPELWQIYSGQEIAGKIEQFEDAFVGVDVGSLTKAMLELCKQASMAAIQIFRFVDDLDEYSGKLIEILELIRSFTTLANVKLCTSSRPENAFVDAYESSVYRLKMEEINKPDIVACVRATLENDRNFQNLEDKDVAGEALLQSIIDGANGIFLWVRLILEDVREKLRDRFSAGMITSQIGKLHGDLEDLFGRILERVRHDDRDRAAAVMNATKAPAAISRRRPFTSMGIRCRLVREYEKALYGGLFSIAYCEIIMYISVSFGFDTIRMSLIPPFGSLSYQNFSGKT